MPMSLAALMIQRDQGEGHAPWRYRAARLGQESGFLAEPGSSLTNESGKRRWDVSDGGMFHPGGVFHPQRRTPRRRKNFFQSADCLFRKDSSSRFWRFRPPGQSRDVCGLREIEVKR